MLRKRPRDKEASASSGVFTSPRGDEIPIKWDNMESVEVLTDMWPLSLALVAVHGLVKGDWLQALLAGIALAMAMLLAAL